MFTTLDLWPLVSLACAYLFGFGGAALINRAKQHSPSWQERSERQRRVLSRLPGTLVGLAIGVTLILSFDH